MKNRGDKGADRDERIIIDEGGEAKEILTRGDRRLNVRFPVCLAVKCGDTVTESCADFAMNLSKGGVFIKTTDPPPVGALLIMHFYIPPEEKLLGELKGRVVGVNVGRSDYPRGVHVKFVDLEKESYERLAAYLEGSRHLVDEEA